MRTRTVGVVWLMIRRPPRSTRLPNPWLLRYKPVQGAQGAAPSPPDYDPAFERRRAEDRIRQLEDEIALLDMEESFNMPDAEKPDADDPDGDDRK